MPTRSNSNTRMVHQEKFQPLSHAFGNPFWNTPIGISLSILILISLSSCHRNKTYNPRTFTEVPPPQKPDYDKLEAWAAHPQKEDLSDTVPLGINSNSDSLLVDVFFIHPTTFLRKSEAWNAELDDAEVNRWTAEGPIQHQASVFNEIGAIYAPRYRQAHIKSYFTNVEDGKGALDLAYEDVKTAFEHFLANRPKNRPFILAAHSQGSTHGIRLIQEFLDGTPLAEKLVAAYLIGMTVLPEMFEYCEACENWGDRSCYITWMTYDRGYKPSFYSEEMKEIEVFNPILGGTFQGENTASQHLGVLDKDFELKYQESILAEGVDGLLWVRKPRIPFGFLMKKKNWHIADYNLFYLNIREGVAQQVIQFFVQEKD